MPTTKIMVVDDNSYFINAATDFLHTEDDMQVIEIAHGGEEALEKMATVKPDIVLLDYVMDGMNGIEITKAIKAMKNPPKIVIVTQFEELIYRKKVMENGADGFVPKTKFSEEIIDVIRSLIE
jgi:DNA-binding NarL/FixJ family response regulator